MRPGRVLVAVEDDRVARHAKLVLDLVTSDATPKRYTASVPLYGAIDPEKSRQSALSDGLRSASW